MRILIALALALSPALAGCIAADAPVPADSAGPVTVTTVTEGRITGLGGGATVGNFYLCCASAHQQGVNLTGTFEVPGNASRILVRLEWADPTFDLDVLVAAPDYAFFLPPEVDWSGPRFRDSDGFSRYAGNGTLLAPDHEAVVDVTDPDALALVGPWSWEVRSKTALDTPFTVTVTVESHPSSPTR